MKIWSRLAYLGAAAVALAPAVAKADDEPDQVEIPALDTNNQPVAAATIGGESADPDANLFPEMIISPKLHVAALPATVQVPPRPEERTPGPPRGRPRAAQRRTLGCCRTASRGMVAASATEDDMYGIHRYCPRCGGYRLLKLRAQRVLVICSGCGLKTDEADPSGAANAETDQEVILRRERWRLESPACAAPLTPMKHS